MSAPTTDLQQKVLDTMAVLTRGKLHRREALTVTTRELSARLGRPGQVLGHSCGELVRKGLLARADRATYRLTRSGITWLTHTHHSRKA
jgi:predicted transcriptional regulator